VAAIGLAAATMLAGAIAATGSRAILEDLEGAGPPPRFEDRRSARVERHRSGAAGSESSRTPPPERRDGSGIAEPSHRTSATDIESFPPTPPGWGDNIGGAELGHRTAAANIVSFPQSPPGWGDGIAAAAVSHRSIAVESESSPYAPPGGGDTLAAPPVPHRDRASGIDSTAGSTAGSTPAADSTPAPWRPRPLSPFAAAKARAILRDQLPCLGCHELHGEGGRIGPELTTVGARRDPGFIRRQIADPARTTPGGLMPRTPMPLATLDLIASYLAAGGAATGTATAGAMDRSAPRREDDAGAARGGDDEVGGGESPPRPGASPSTLYARHCATCHGAEGRGDGPNARHLPVPPARHADARAMARRTDDALFDVIHGGGRVLGVSPRMPAFGGALSRDEIRALVRHIRALCRCEGPAWSRDGSRG
jgi:hypothetical protein